jgi:D-specific alpha-keto acid dehydrogenase
MTSAGSSLRTDTGLTVYSCEPDEAALFAALSPRFGIVPALLPAPVTPVTANAAAGTRCVSVGHKSEVGRATLDALGAVGVRYLSTRSIGFDHIDLAAAEDAGIVVENVVYAPDGVADFTLMLMLMAIRGAKETARAAERHEFRLRETRGRELRDMTVGVVGVGRIGAAVIERLRGFGCRVLACDNGRGAAVAAERVPFAELLRASDVVTLHVPLTAGTRHLIGRAELAAMKPGAFLVNTARGALVDTAALIAALERGRLGGAALDVLEGESRRFSADRAEEHLGDPLLQRLQELPNAIITPHTAYHTEGALHDTVERTLIQCRAFERSRE